MPRRTRLRKVVSPPKFKGYMPYGGKEVVGESIPLLYEEYEALKLADYDLLNHEEASNLMGVSRATFARIYENARRKIAKALVEAKEIKSVYGNAWLDKDWFRCDKCKAKFTIPKTHKEILCPLCSSKEINSTNK